MGQVVLDGSITVGPVTSGGGSFPTAVNTVSISTTPNPKQASVYSSDVRQLQTAAYVALSGIGASDTVTKGTFLYLKVTGAMFIRKTTFDVVPLVAETPVQGTLIQEFPDTNYLMLLEAKGNGTVEYFVSGQS